MLGQRAIVVALLCLALSGCQLFSKKKPPPKLLETGQTVKDLYYGDALFYFYQDDYLEALTRIDAALTLDRVPNHMIESRLLRGGLYLSFGEHVEAGRVFKELLNENVPDATRNRIWFFLAKVWYQRGYLQDADHALTSIAGKLEGGLESERQLLHAEVLLGQRRYAEAITALSAIPREDRYAPYARFNLGVALVREQRTNDAVAMLDDVGLMVAPTEELASLRDKANLALGFAFLKDNRPLEAAQRLQRVRLKGPLSNKALLGAGWASASQNNYRAALAPWQELHGRDLLDPAVQEAHLAVPFAYNKLSATRQAAEKYATAIDLFNGESQRIDQSISAIRSGGLLATVLANEPKRESDAKSGWYWQLQKLPDAAETRYLYHLLSSHAFQEGLKNFRDLKLMQRNLARWSQSAEAFQAMVEAKHVAYEQRVPKMDAILDQVDLPGLEARAVEFGSRLSAIEREGDVVGLATDKEGAQWQTVQMLNEAIGSADPADPAIAEMQEKLRMLKGVLFWNMSSGFKARLWHARKEQRELEVAVKEARRRWTLIERARVDSPKQTEEFAKRVVNVQPRIEAMISKLETVAIQHDQYLSNIAIRELSAQKERLSSYGLQAQFALASIYDQAANGPVEPRSSQPTAASPSGEIDSSDDSSSESESETETDPDQFDPDATGSSSTESSSTESNSDESPPDETGSNESTQPTSSTEAASAEPRVTTTPIVDQPTQSDQPVQPGQPVQPVMSGNAEVQQ